MLLQRLVEYAAGRDEPAPPLHRELEFHWQLELTSRGTLASPHLTPLVDDSGGTARGVRHVTPSAVRSGPKPPPMLAADDIAYVLGWADDPGKAGSTTDRHAAFVDLCRRWATSPEGIQDPVARAVARFYDTGGEADVVRPEEFTSKQRVLLAVDGVPAYRAASVVSFWSSEVAARKAGGSTGLCLVCGRTGALLDTLPGKVKSTLVPGATNDAALVSINERVFGYDLTTQLAGSPVCLTCGEAIGAALVDLLGSGHATSYGDQDSALTWWLTKATGYDPMQLLDQADPADVGPWLAAVHRGRPPDTAIAEDSTFCSLTVGGNVARIVVRDWVEMPLADLDRNLAAWFDDHEMSPVSHDRRRHHSMYRLALCLGRWDNRQSRYLDFRARGADRPAHAHRDLQRAAIRGWPVPVSVLRHVIHRVTSDGHLDDARAALIRLCLTRSPLTVEKPMPDLDSSLADPAYVAGRIFAVLEQIQQDANLDQKLNTTYGDRYFSGAVLNPRAAITSGRRDAKAWLKKLRRQGTAHYRERELDDLFALIDPHVGLPGRATLLQQSQFLLGYHQQRAHRWEQIRAHQAAAGAAAGHTTNQPLTPAPNDTIEETNQ
jgi:CRISPR-associated protein Csd1